MYKEKTFPHYTSYVYNRFVYNCIVYLYTSMQTNNFSTSPSPHTSEMQIKEAIKLISLCRILAQNSHNNVKHKNTKPHFYCVSRNPVEMVLFGKIMYLNF